MSGIGKARSSAYRVARELGDLQAVERGYRRGGVAGAVGGQGKRLIRRRVYRRSNRAVGALLRAIGLG